MLTTLFYVLLAIIITAITVFVLMSFVFIDYLFELITLGNKKK